MTLLKWLTTQPCAVLGYVKNGTKYVFKNVLIMFNSEINHLKYGVLLRWVVSLRLAKRCDAIRWVTLRRIVWYCIIFLCCAALFCI